MPKVTVLMTVYNGERHLREAIEGVLRQTFQDFEFLIINDGSSDSTREVTLSYRDPRIRLVNNEHNLGQTRSLNRGLELAKGQFIARQDADDISEPERLARQVAFLETHAEVALLGTWYKKIDAQGNPLGDRKLPCDCMDIRWSLLFFCPFVHSSVMLRKSAILEQIGFYDETFAYAQDYELWSRIARRLAVANLGEFLVKYRTTPWSMTSTYGVRVNDEILRISTANICHLLGADEAKRIMNSVAHFNNVSLLLFGSHGSLRSAEAIKAACAVLRLHTSFCQYYGNSRNDCRTHRAALCSHMGRRIVDIALCKFNQNNLAASQVVRQAFRLHWPIVLANRIAWLYFSCLRATSVREN
ncbi:MAG: hypothetical protein DMG05_22715 [Acidobacteria bacterium]|nr:MAG: hypothetical protein DMG05_22715 [Acidobacteriota bacterium]